MTAMNMTAQDVIAAIQAQNIQVASGQIGQPPVSGNQQQQLRNDIKALVSDFKQLLQVITQIAETPRRSTASPS